MEDHQEKKVVELAFPKLSEGESEFTPKGRGQDFLQH
jgi:hypothetical protein